MLKRFLLPLLLVFLTLIGLSEWFGLDLYLANAIYDPSSVGGRPGWGKGYLFPWSILNEYGEIPGVLLAVSSLVLLLGGLHYANLKKHRRACQLVLVAIAFGPCAGTWGMRQFWGRPRPRDVQAFGDTEPYRSWTSPGGPGFGKSFPSGHASISFSLVILAFLPNQRRRRLRVAIMTGGLAYGGLVATARMMRGAHFFSDVCGGAVFGLLGIAIACWLLSPDDKPDDRGGARASPLEPGTTYTPGGQAA